MCGRFNDQPSLIADIVNDILKPVEIDPALTEQESVFLAVNLADILAAQAIDLPVDIVTHFIGVGYVVVNLHRG